MSDRPLLGALDLNQLDDARTVAQQAVIQARAFDAPLHLVAVLPYGHYATIDAYIPQSAVEEIFKAAEDGMGALATALNFPAERMVTSVRRGVVYEQILELATAIDARMIVLSARRPKAERYTLGPNAVQISRYADCSVLILRPS